MGGVGKTTLARLVYNDKQVKEHFKLCKAWVCVSDKFDIPGISKVIFQSVTGVNKDFADFNLLQVALKDHLRGKRFLLVLDDVWTEIPQDWETLVGPFLECARGSKVIMTTRKDKLLKNLGYGDQKPLESLLDDAALSLLSHHAFYKKVPKQLLLLKYGEPIVGKCGGLPLALKALGSLLNTKKDEEEQWKEVLDSEIWRLQAGGEILPALRVSYHDLSARLKQLFAYCSLFPKDFIFDKEELVQLWMAEGFLHQSTTNGLTEERLGHECFNELLSRSFFQNAPNNELLYVMHDLMNDLATYFAREYFLRLEKDFRNEAFEKHRHMSFIREEYVTYKKFENINTALSLRTFLPTSAGGFKSWPFFYLSSKIMFDLLPKLPLLRVLSLSYFYISEVPESVGSLRHLRYLNLSRTNIKHLPESICNLYNLQTLILFGCYSLKELPNSFLKLKNLRHFDISDTPFLRKMPLGIGELKNLQTLSKIIIEDERRFEIAKLKEFENLCGKISIVGLGRLQDAKHTQEASFSQKKLSELEVVWSDVPDGSQNTLLEREVLNALKPHNSYLEELKIVSYGGLQFSNWVGDPSFVRLKHVSMRGCKNCTSLPPLGQLPSLKELYIERMDRIEVVDLGTDGAFPSFEILSFEKMPMWEKWTTNSGNLSFPCLQKLIVRGCPKLVDVSLKNLPSLYILEIDGCDRRVLEGLIQVASAVTVLEIHDISGLSDMVWEDVTKYLGSVEDLIIENCNEIRYMWESEAVASEVLVKLRKLIVRNCGELVSLGNKKEDNFRSNLPTSLKILEVYASDQMSLCTCPGNIETLTVSGCPLIDISCPAGRQKLKSLDIGGFEKLLERRLSGQKIIELNQFLHLTELKISFYTGLESFPTKGLSSLTSLKDLQIMSCPNMDASFPSGFWPPSLHSLKIGGLKKPISEWGPQNFPTSLVKLILTSEDGVTTCTQFSQVLPSSLTSLFIEEFDNLESVSFGLQHLTSLQHLSFERCLNLNNLSHSEHLTSLQSLSFDVCPNLNQLSHPQHPTSLQHLSFTYCENMVDLPEVLLSSLLGLTIYRSPNLIKRCSKEGCYWPLISSIPRINIKVSDEEGEQQQASDSSSSHETVSPNS